MLCGQIVDEHKSPFFYKKCACLIHKKNARLAGFTGNHAKRLAGRTRPCLLLGR